MRFRWLWGGNSGTWDAATSGNNLTYPSDATAKVGTVFTIYSGGIGTYTFDLIFDGHIIWTAPTVTVT